MREAARSKMDLQREKIVSVHMGQGVVTEFACCIRQSLETKEASPAFCFQEQPDVGQRQGMNARSLPCCLTLVFGCTATGHGS